MSKETRTLEDALINAERLRSELPHLVQPEATCYDMINMADEIYKLRGQLENYKKYEARMN